MVRERLRSPDIWPEARSVLIISPMSPSCVENEKLEAVDEEYRVSSEMCGALVSAKISGKPDILSAESHPGSLRYGHSISSLRTLFLYYVDVKNVPFIGGT